MTKFARIQNNVATDVVADDPAGRFHPDLAGEFSEVPDTVERGWVLDPDMDTWSAPAVVEDTPDQAYRTVVTPPEFLLLFTAAERVAIRAARESDPVIGDWLAILEDPRLTQVDVTLQATRDGLDYLVAQGHITAASAAEIKLGAPL